MLAPECGLRMKLSMVLSDRTNYAKVFLCYLRLFLLDSPAFELLSWFFCFTFSCDFFSGLPVLKHINIAGNSNRRGIAAKVY